MNFFLLFDFFFINYIYIFYIFLFIFSLTFSFIKSIYEFNFYKLFAYSGIGNYSFALLPYFLIDKVSDLLPFFFYLYVYCFTLVGFFILFSSSFLFVKYKGFTITSSFTFFSSKKNYLLSIFFVGYMLSFSGFPFFIGFLVKGFLSYFFILK